jgi:hypothetical protein
LTIVEQSPDGKRFGASLYRFTQTIPEALLRIEQDKPTRADLSHGLTEFDVHGAATGCNL